MSFRLPSLALVLITAIAASPVLARPGDPGWGAGAYGPGWNGRGGGNDLHEGKVTVDRFVAQDVGSALSQTHNGVTAAPGDPGDERTSAIFAAAVVDQLAKAGYDTINPDPHGGLLTQVRGRRDVVVPEEPKHRPVNGEIGAGVSNFGSALGLGLSIDLSKRRKALIDTKLEARILDRASGKALWESRADIITRDGDAHWTDTAIAARLAGALFEHFQGPRP